MSLEGWSVRAKQGGWEWDAWVRNASRLGVARTEERACDAALAALNKLRAPLGLIAAERQRQIDSEGWTPEHDDTHTVGELAAAAAAYAYPGALRTRDGRSVQKFLLWPWDEGGAYKPTSRVRELVKAGALIVAEIERIQRALDS